ncbi:MAG TPA: DNA-binding protein [Phycisphaerales bacterium]|nr:DNA-binding protein [Phycisphaerales bacterium]
MAGMFYSLQEVAEKLNKTEEEVKKIVKEGRLREFRDGPNLLFKIDEVEALMSETSITASEQIAAGTEQETDEDEISLAPETTEEPTVESGLTGEETAISGEGINVLGETDHDYKLADDTMAETKAASDEASLEEIEEDVNLDTFGSGSGLLDLSLQADDTSLGGILDEIYTSEGDEGQGAGGSGSAMEVAAEAEQMLPETPQPGLEAPAIIAQAYEPEPDTLSNAFGYMLFLPLLAIVYTAIVAVAGFKDVMPVILEKVQGVIWYIMIGIAVAAISIVGVAFMLSGQGGKADKKQKAKTKKPKKPKKSKKAKEKPQPTPEPESKTP